MKQLTEDPVKTAIVERLVKEGAIDFTEAIALLEADPAPFVWPIVDPIQPQPWGPAVPWYLQGVPTTTCVINTTGN